ncbi:uncharacterized mitochondrial protein AtMg00860-like [Benincasa hispida]|uniref:uncharacterized mitochondrial protein AtMg00860-like n=1 Tax=Benincasa hispida TaxID=102211 RepID=UPI001901B4A5|nr:uncharacterized mitochondrial protein AtMg00860-like [Benincasa hispida]
MEVRKKPSRTNSNMMKSKKPLTQTELEEPEIMEPEVVTTSKPPDHGTMKVQLPPFLQRLKKKQNDEVYGKTYEVCLKNLERILKRCEETNLVLNWEKCHFMVKEGIVLRHRVSKDGLEVDREKIEVIEILPPPANIQALRSFLGQVGFYRQFVKKFSKIARPLNALLEADRTFDFDPHCLTVFKKLKDALTTVPILISLDGTKPFELMCDASRYAMGAVLA